MNKMSFRIIVRDLEGTSANINNQKYMNQIKNNSPENNDYLRIQKIWKEAENSRIFNSIDTKGDWQVVKSRMQKTHVSRSHRLPLYVIAGRVAAVLILAFGLAFGFYKILTLQKTETVRLYTFNADEAVREVHLPDGSVISLNIGSTLTYGDDFNQTSRDVNLHGEGLFDIVSGQDLAFRVLTRESVIEVTGTTFSIHESDGVIKVAVIEGTVSLSTVDSDNNQINISQNQSGFVLPNNELMIKNGLDANNLSWKTGLLIFDETPLDSALADIAHHFRKDLQVEAEIAEKVTAEFEHQPLGEILNELEQVAGLVFDTTGGSLIVRK